MNLFIHLSDLLLFICLLNLDFCSGRATQESLSSDCTIHRDSVVIGHCVRPWIDIWEKTRQHEAAHSDLVYPLLYYSRDEIAGLCDVYLQIREECLSDSVMNRCHKHPLVSFLQSHMGFICGENSVEIMTHFDCISSAVKRKKQCRDHLKGLAIPGLDKNKCASMPQFYDCIRFEVEGRCGLVGLSALETAIANFNCDLFAPQTEVGEDVDDITTEIFYTYADSIESEPPTIVPAAPATTFEFNIAAQSTVDVGLNYEYGYETTNPTPIIDNRPLTVGPITNELIQIDNDYEYGSFTPIQTNQLHVADDVTDYDYASAPKWANQFPSAAVIGYDHLQQQLTDDKSISTEFEPIELDSQQPFSQNVKSEFDVTPPHSATPIPQSPIPVTPSLNGEECTPERAEAVSNCLAPLIDLWDQTRDNQPEINQVAFPLYKYSTGALLNLCDVYTRVENHCMRPGDMDACVQETPVKFIYSLFGYACGRQETDFFLSFDCISMVTRHNGHCMEFVRGETVPGKMDTRCKGVSDYYLCMEPLVGERCESQSLKVFRKSIEHFGCQVPLITDKKERSEIDFLASEDDANSVNEEVEAVVDNGIEQRDGFPFQNTDIIDEQVEQNVVLLDAPPKLPLPNARNVPTDAIGNQCTTPMKDQVRHCLVPLMNTWDQLMSQRTVNEIRFPIYTFKSNDILEMCDQYANAFLACPFNLFEACLEDDVVRFANNLMGYICSPQNLATFLRNFDCVSRVFQSRPPCTKPLLGTIAPGKDHNRCVGMSQFISCSRSTIESQCGDRALAEMQQTITQFGCDVL